MMPEPAYGLTWYLWRRHHRGFMIILACGLALSVLTHTMPSSEGLSILIIVPSQLLFLGLLVMAIFAHAGADVLTTSSGYPTHLWILPVKTRQLVAWPMFLGTTLVALFYIGFEQFVFRPGGIDLFLSGVSPLRWPAAMLASMLTCLQAVFWSAFPVPYLRVILYIVIWSSMITAGVVMDRLNFPEWKIVVVFLGVIPFAYIAAFTGLSRARRGSVKPWQWPSLAFLKTNARFQKSKKRFASIVAAQFWFEWHRNGVMLPLCVFGTLMLLSIPFLWVRETERLGFFFSNAPGNIEGNVWLRPSQISLFLPLFFGMVFGCGFRGAGGRQEDSSINSFLATRPLTFSQLTVAKIKTAALSSVAAWSILLLFLAIWLLLPGSDGDYTGPLGIVLLKHCTPGALRELLLGLALGMLWTCQMQAQGSLIRCMSRPWIALTVAGLYLSAFMFEILLLGHPRWYPQFIRILLLLAVLAAGFKLLSLAIVSFSLYRRKLADVKKIAAVLTIWLSVVSCLFVLLGRIYSTHSLLNIAIAAVLLVPIVRFLVMPLALQQTRHN